MNEIEFERGVELLVDQRLGILDLIEAACSSEEEAAALRSRQKEINDDVDMTMWGLSDYEMQELDIEASQRVATVIKFREQIDRENFDRTYDMSKSRREY